MAVLVKGRTEAEEVNIHPISSALSSLEDRQHTRRPNARVSALGVRHLAVQRGTALAVDANM